MFDMLQTACQTVLKVFGFINFTRRPAWGWGIFTLDSVLYICIGGSSLLYAEAVLLL